MLLELLKTKLEQLSNTSSKIFYSQIFFQVKWIAVQGTFLKKKKSIAFGKTELANATYGLHILSTTIFQE